MGKPNNSLANIKLPGENTQRPIIPYAIGVSSSNSYQATLPALEEDATIAIDASVVHKTGDETIWGTKTFRSTSDYESYYVDIKSGKIGLKILNSQSVLGDSYISPSKIQLKALNDIDLILQNGDTKFNVKVPGGDGGAATPIQLITSDNYDHSYTLTVPFKTGTVATLEDFETETSKYQSTSVIVGNAVTNINGRVFQNYTATLVTAGGYTFYQILKNGNNPTEEEAKEYMRYMTGSTFLPKYNYDFPKQTVFTFADRSTWKPQYSSNDGLRLYRLTTPLALASDIPTVNNGTLIIQGNGTAASTFTANQSGNTTLNVKGSGITIVTRSAADEITIESKNLVETTWTNLKSLRDSSQLVPGRFYRITDYTCTTITTNTSSAGHVFDIIVLALENNKLNEEAWAALHSGDTYFASNNLSAWKLWYCLDNDTNRFTWADSTNGKGVIYRMIDEFGNDVAYDFKNILFTDSSETPKYTSAYTFNYIQSGVGKDASLSGKDKTCTDNIIKEYINSNKKQELNFNVFCSANTMFKCNFNIFDKDCYYNTFGRVCYNNTFATVCHHNTFGDTCHDNIFSYGCTGNTFGKTCHTNIFNYGCANNTFGASCQGNTFGTTCISNTFGNNCTDNRFGNNCRNNIFSNMCKGNTFGNSCQNNTFDNNCQDNIFGIGCTFNTFDRSCCLNIFNAGCTFNTFGVACSYNTFGIRCRYVTFGDSSSAIDYCLSNELDNDCSFLYINASSTSSSSDELQNIHIHLGVSGTSTEYKTITVDRGLSYSVDVYPVGSTEIFI